MSIYNLLFMTDTSDSMFYIQYPSIIIDYTPMPLPR